MIEKNSTKMEGIDETEIFKSLWGKRYLIITITVLSIIAGVIHVYYLRPVNYMVSSVLKFKDVTPQYVDDLFSFGQIDLDGYNKSGKIEKADSLAFSEEDKRLLNQFKDKISIGLDRDNSHIVIKGETTDTTTLKEGVGEVASAIQKAMYNLSKACFEYNRDSLSQLQSKIKTELQDSLKNLLLAEDKLKTSNSLDGKVAIIYSEYYNEYFISSKIDEIQKIQQYEDMFSKIDIERTGINVEIVQAKLGSRPLLVRWAFFGFAAGCVAAYLLSLLKKRK